MAIFSLNLKSIGRSTHEPGTAAAHLRYILRDGACEAVVARGIPTTPAAAASWINEQEVADRANARVCDKLILAIPCELTIEQMLELLKDYCELMSNGAPYVAALHRPSGKDDRNWHGHTVFRDRCPLTGKRLMHTSERGAVDRFRVTWEEAANAALARAGHDERIDHRSLMDQGEDRLPQIHEGVAARAMAAHGKPLVSTDKLVRNGVCANTPYRTVRYTEIDSGATRHQENVMRERSSAILQFGKRVSAAHDAMAAAGFESLASLRDSDRSAATTHASPIFGVRLSEPHATGTQRRRQRQRESREQTRWRTTDDFHADVVQSASRPRSERRRRSSRFEAGAVEDTATAPQGLMTAPSAEESRFTSADDRDRAVAALRAATSDDVGIVPPRSGPSQPKPAEMALPMPPGTMHESKRPVEPTGLAAKPSGGDAEAKAKEFVEYFNMPTRRRAESTSDSIASLRAELARMKVEVTLFSRTLGNTNMRGLRIRMTHLGTALAALTNAQLREWEAHERRAAEDSAKHLAIWRKMVEATKREARSQGFG